MLSGTHLDHLLYMVTWSPGPPGLHGLHGLPGPYDLHGPHGHLVGEHIFQLCLKDTKNQNKNVSTGSVLR